MQYLLAGSGLTSQKGCGVMPRILFVKSGRTALRRSVPMCAVVWNQSLKQQRRMIRIAIMITIQSHSSFLSPTPPTKFDILKLPPVLVSLYSIQNRK